MSAAESGPELGPRPAAALTWRTIQQQLSAGQLRFWRYAVDIDDERLMTGAAANALRSFDEDLLKLLSADISRAWPSASPAEARGLRAVHTAIRLVRAEREARDRRNQPPPPLVNQLLLELTREGSR